MCLFLKFCLYNLGSVASTLNKIAENLPALTLRLPTHSAIKTMEDVVQGAKAMLDKSRRAVAMGNELVKTTKDDQPVADALTDAPSWPDEGAQEGLF